MKDDTAQKARRAFHLRLRGETLAQIGLKLGGLSYERARQLSIMGWHNYARENNIIPPEAPFVNHELTYEGWDGFMKWRAERTKAER